MNLLDLFVKIGVDDQATDKVESIASKLGNGLKTAAKIGTAAVTAAATGVAALTTAAVKNYAEYEQLVGGAELMFGEAYGKIANYAAEAFTTVQLSQNEYLKQVNGFATGLKTALGGNEEQAADLAHKIVQAEADIIAATGNTAENVQNAFNGIMRSNFTMLDNLQIGIKPTKEGFQEVIDKVNEWNETNGKATQYQMDNLADMQSALVDYIEMIGYSGYAANEASGTIQGSLASMKAAWTNLIAGISNDEADFDKLLDNLVGSVGTVVQNIMPRVELAITGIGNLLQKVAPMVIDTLPIIVQDILPSLFQSATDIIVYLGKSLLDNAPLLITTALGIILELANDIIDSLPVIIPYLVDVILNIVEILTHPDTLVPLLEAAFKIIVALADGLIDAIPNLLARIPQIIVNIVGVLLRDGVPMLIEAGGQLLAGLWNGFLSPEAMIKNIKLFGEAFVKGIKDFFGIKSPSRLMRDEVGRMLVRGIGAGFNEEFPNLKMSINQSLLDLEKGFNVDFASNPYSSTNSSSKIVNVTQNIYSQAKSAAELMREAILEQETAVMMGV